MSKCPNCDEFLSHDEEVYYCIYCEYIKYLPGIDDKVYLPGIPEEMEVI